MMKNEFLCQQERTKNMLLCVNLKFYWVIFSFKACTEKWFSFSQTMTHAVVPFFVQEHFLSARSDISG